MTDSFYDDPGYAQADDDHAVWSYVTGGELAEWSYRAGGFRVTHSVMLMRRRGLALLTVLFESPQPFNASQRSLIAIPPGVDAGGIEKSRALQLAAPGKPGTAQVLPLALPAVPYLTERGAFAFDGRAGALEQHPFAVAEGELADVQHGARAFSMRGCRPQIPCL